jgi:hypothetical protein
MEPKPKKARARDGRIGALQGWIIEMKILTEDMEGRIKMYGHDADLRSPFVDLEELIAKAFDMMPYIVADYDSDGRPGPGGKS